MSEMLKKFQRQAINDLKATMGGEKRNIILKSPTGSGKTMMLTTFMSEYLLESSQTVFIWLTPGKGNLEEQSKKKMDQYICSSHTKLLSDIMVEGFEEDDCCFINWEKLTKKGNNALKESERTNFLEWIQKALDEGLSFKIIVDESHQNFTAKADEIIQYFHTDKIIRSSATPLSDPKAVLVEVKESDVIAEGLIKKMIVINENFPQKIENENPTEYLLQKGYEKWDELRHRFLEEGSDINPLIVVQLPNGTDTLLESVEAFFEKKYGVNYEMGNLAVWLSDKKKNLEGIESIDAKPIAVIIKQAIATGWDCPRAHILVKLRENMDETFEIQTIGRIRRMPEAHHYGNDLLDSCYLYTFDDKFTQGVKNTLGKGALESMTLFLREDLNLPSLTAQRRKTDENMQSPDEARIAITEYFKKCGLILDGNKEEQEENKRKLENDKGYIFKNEIVRYTISGKIHELSEIQKSKDLNGIELFEKLNTHDGGRAMLHSASEIGAEIGIDYHFMRTILFRFFCEQNKQKGKFFSLSVRDMYCFIINNCDLLRRDCREAMAIPLTQKTISFENVTEEEFNITKSVMFTYDNTDKEQEENKKNVYKGYLLSAEPRSSSERKFERFCNNCESVDWFYKNGDKGEEYFSIVYEENAGKQNLFYPDYIVSIKGVTWIIETKGGFSDSGESQDIDRFSLKKFAALKDYIGKQNEKNKEKNLPEIRGGFVRFYKDNLIIATEEYSEDVKSDSWMILDKFVAGL